MEHEKCKETYLHISIHHLSKFVHETDPRKIMNVYSSPYVFHDQNSSTKNGILSLDALYCKKLGTERVHPCNPDVVQK